MESAFIIKSHAIVRYLERMCGHHIRDWSELTAELRKETKRLILDELTRAVTLPIEARPLIMSQTSLKGIGKNITHSVYALRNDSDYLLYHDRVYFLRKGTQLVVSVIRLPFSQLALLEEKCGKDFQRDRKIAQKKPAHSDARIRVARSEVVFARHITSMLQTVFGWSEQRAREEIQPLIAEDLTIIPRSIIRQRCNVKLEPYITYRLHARSGILFGVTALTDPSSENASSNRFEVVFMKWLESEVMQRILRDKPEALYGSFDTDIRCSAIVFSHTRTDYGWTKAYTMEKIIREFRDEDSTMLSREQTPVNDSIAENHTVVCYQTPELYLWFDGLHVVSIERRKDFQGGELMKRSA